MHTVNAISHPSSGSHTDLSQMTPTLYIPLATNIFVSLGWAGNIHNFNFNFLIHNSSQFLAQKVGLRASLPEIFPKKLSRPSIPSGFISSAYFFSVRIDTIRRSPDGWHFVGSPVPAAVATAPRAFAWLCLRFAFCSETVFLGCLRIAALGKYHRVFRVKKLRFVFF